MLQVPVSRTYRFCFQVVCLYTSIVFNTSAIACIDGHVWVVYCLFLVQGVDSQRVNILSVTRQNSAIHLRELHDSVWIMLNLSA